MLMGIDLWESNKKLTANSTHVIPIGGLALSSSSGHSKVLIHSTNVAV
jgi:hypothetical protein